MYANINTNNNILSYRFFVQSDNIYGKQYKTDEFILNSVFLLNCVNVNCYMNRNLQSDFYESNTQKKTDELLV